MFLSIRSFSWHDVLVACAIGVSYSFLLVVITSNLSLSLGRSLEIAILLFLPLASPVFLSIAHVGTRILPSSLQIAKFILVGTLNTLIDLAVLNLLLGLLGINSASSWYAVCKAVSFSVAVINSYLWNRYWVFNQTGQATKKEVMQFFAVSVVGLCINTAIAWLVFALLNGRLPSTIGANIGAIVGTLVVLAWNFAGYKFIVFRNTMND